MNKTKQAILEDFSKLYNEDGFSTDKQDLLDFLSTALDRMKHEGIHEGGEKALGNQGDMILEIRKIARQETLEEIRTILESDKQIEVADFDGTLWVEAKDVISIIDELSKLKSGGKRG